MEQFVNILFGIIQLILIIYILYFEVTKKSSASFLWATLLIMFGLPHLLTTIALDVEYSVSTILKASVFVSLFCTFYILVRKKKENSFLEVWDRSKLTIEKTEITNSAFEKICFLVFLVSIIWYMITVVRRQGGLLNTAWAWGNSGGDSYVSLLGLIIRFIFAFSGFSLYYFLTKRKRKAFFVLFLFLAMVVITRNRVQVIPVLLFPISLFLLKIKKIKIKHIIYASLAGIVVIYIVYGIRAFRYLGSLSNAINNMSLEYLNSQIMYFISSKNGELGLRQDFYFFIEKNNNFEGFNRGYTYIRMLLVYLPSQWTFGLKPQSFDLYMGQAIGMVAGGTTHPTLFGDCFGNLNWFGTLLGIFWAAFANTIDRITIRQTDAFYKIMIYFLAGYAYIVMGRGSVYNGFEILAWGVLFIQLFKVFLEGTKKVRLKRIHFIRDNS